MKIGTICAQRQQTLSGSNVNNRRLANVSKPSQAATKIVEIMIGFVCSVCQISGGGKNKNKIYMWPSSAKQSLCKSVQTMCCIVHGGKSM
jgi:hypothetical protein